MKKLDKHSKNTDNTVDFKGEQRGCLSSNNISERCSPLNIDSNNKSKDELLDELADIFVDSILWEIKNGKQEGSDLLPGLDKGTS